jgi:hypothetical protein
MIKQTFLLAVAATLGGLAVSASGCLGGDPNMNSQLYNPNPSGDAAPPSGAGGGGGSGINPNGPIVGTPVATFDTTIEGFALSTFADTNQTNLGDPSKGFSPTLAFDMTTGSPDPGSLVLMAPYSGASQYVDIQKDFTVSNYHDWSGRTVHVRIKVSSGVFKGGTQVYAKSGSAYFFAGTYTNLASNSNWQEFTLNLTSPMTLGTGAGGPFDPSHVVAVGLQLNTGSAGGGSTPVTFNIDSFSVDPPLPGTDAGGDAPPATSDAAGD